jgi:VanZ family protein
MKKYLFTEITSIAIVVLSLIPIPEEPPLADVPLIDKWVHFVMYAALSLVMWFDHIVMNKKAMSPTFLLLTFLYPAFLGGMMELAQAYLTTCRSGDFIDFVANVIGAVIGVICCFLFNKLWNEKNSVRR